MKEREVWESLVPCREKRWVRNWMLSDGNKGTVTWLSECRSSNISRSLRGYGCVNSIWKTGRFCCPHSLGLSLANTRNWSSKSIEAHRTWATISRPTLLRETKSKWRCRQKSRSRSNVVRDKFRARRRSWDISGSAMRLIGCHWRVLTGRNWEKSHAVWSARVVHHLATCCRRLLLTSSTTRSLERSSMQISRVHFNDLK